MEDILVGAVEEVGIITAGIIRKAAITTMAANIAEIVIITKSNFLWLWDTSIPCMFVQPGGAVVPPGICDGNRILMHVFPQRLPPENVFPEIPSGRRYMMM